MNIIEIFIQSAGTTTPLSIGENETIGNLKKNIFKQINLAPEKQKLVFFGKKIDDDRKTIREYNIGNKSHVTVISKNYMEIDVETDDGNIFKVDIEADDKIQNLKRKIGDETGLEIEMQTISYQGKILEDDKLIKDYHLVSGCLVTVADKRTYDIRIIIETMDGKKFELKVKSSDTIIDLKMKLYESGKDVPKFLRLVFKNDILDDKKTVKDYNISNKSIIKMLDEMKIEMKIIAQIIDGGKFGLKITKGDKVMDVKKKIQSKSGLSKDNQRLRFHDHDLNDDNLMMHYYSIEENGIIEVWDESKPFDILMRKLDGKTKKITVSKMDLIPTVKEKFKTELNVKEQVLVCGRNILTDDRRLADYQIKDGDVIDVIPAWQTVVLVAKLSNGKSAVLEPKMKKTVNDLKESIKKKFDIGLQITQLKFDQKLLDDGEYIGMCGFYHKSVIEVV